MKRRAKNFILRPARPLRSEKYRTILMIGALCFLVIIFCSVLIFLTTPVKIAGNFECSIKGNINNTDGGLKIQQLSDIQCAGTFDTEIPLGFIAFIGDVN